MKKSDFLEKMFLEMAGEIPELVRVLVDERDMYLTQSIWSVTGMPHYSKLQTSELHPSVTRKEEGPIGDYESMVRQRTTMGDTENSIPQSATPPSDPLNVNTPSNSLIPACCSYWPSPSVLPRVVVAVVGIGHVNGIKKYWSSAESIDVSALTT